MYLPAVMQRFAGLAPDEALTYAPSTGAPVLRSRWKSLMTEKNPSLKDVEFGIPVVTSGITHGLSIVADLFVDRGDLVLLPEKLWGNYNMIFGVRRGARIAKYPFFNDAGGFDVEGFRRCLAEHATAGKIILVLNFPNNPTGYSATEQEASAIRAAIEDSARCGGNLVAVCDDAYFGLFYGADVARESLFTRLAGSHERILAVKLDGATKEDYVWGFRVGFLTFGAKGLTSAACDALEKKAGGCIRGTISNCPQPSQSILLKAMSDPDYAGQRREKHDVLRRRAERVRTVLADAKFAVAWTPYPFNSGYFMCLKLKELNAELFRLRLLEKHGIGVIATSATDVRVAFSCVEEQSIGDLFEQMFRCAQEMAGDAAALAQPVPLGAFEE
jgi:aspartate/methionine/tyrosine aminotransferase